MTPPSSGALRAGRSASAGGVVLALASAAHVLGGGRLPGLVGWLTLATLVGCVSFTVTRRRLGAPSVLALLGVGQVVLHGAFMALAPGSAMLHQTGPGHRHGPDLLSATLTTPGTPLLAGVPMVLLHTVATVATALALAHGEALLWRWWAWCRPLATPLSTLITVVGVRLPRNRFAAPVLLPARSLPGRRSRRRGPPVGICAA